ncbi:MAG: chorismate pyruvate-lyase family protein [Cyanobacteria bacterium J06623_7]
MVIAAPALNFQPKQATLPVKSFLQRLLLVTDGRITDIVQAYAGETVEAVKLRNQLIISGSRRSPLQLDREYQLLDRSILLQGLETKTNYLYADSKIVLERLDGKISDKLIFSQEPIGKLLRENKIETYREILDCGIEPAGSLGAYFDIKPSAKLIYRTYIVLIAGLPVMQITEKFPTTHFVD